ncbi:MAG TPA: O-sialoglycoprotein endopeptidase [Firmicutes bacterium]|nr:O-sialoglycoprotein endopeptidase [Bacillota bacterium]
MKFFLGVDTSNYTTSLCLLRQDGVIAADLRQMLTVASGGRGLRQSEALFQHVLNLPELAGKMRHYLRGGEIAAVGVATKPRPWADSYMPVFLPGRGLAVSLAELLDVECYSISHQENHIYSGIGGAGGPTGDEFLTIHLSGGTTELVRAELDRRDWSLDLEIWGETLDLHAGQLIDRLGVELGLDFPAGPELEHLALQAATSVPVATYHKAGQVSFSGPLTALERLIGKESRQVLALSCFEAVTRTLLKWIKWAGKKAETRDLLIVGGVAANSIIRGRLQHSLRDWNLYFAPARLSTDNACGAAYYAALAAGALPFGSKFSD